MWLLEIGMLILAILALVVCMYLLYDLAIKRTKWSKILDEIATNQNIENYKLRYRMSCYTDDNTKNQCPGCGELYCCCNCEHKERCEDPCIPVKKFVKSIDSSCFKKWNNNTNCEDVKNEKKETQN